MTNLIRQIIATCFLVMPAVAAGDDCAEHSAHAAKVDARGDHAMGFSHEKTAHHFVLTPTGGVIIATTDDPKDAKSRSRIVGHFRHIAAAFKKGDFDMPMFIHDRVPPGVPEMKRLARQIAYRAEETETGGRVVINSTSAAAIAAVHELLRFQIDDHRTGDSTAIQP